LGQDQADRAATRHWYTNEGCTFHWSLFARADRQREWECK